MVLIYGPGSELRKTTASISPPSSYLYGRVFYFDRSNQTFWRNGILIVHRKITSLAFDLVAVPSSFLGTSSPLVAASSDFVAPSSPFVSFWKISSSGLYFFAN